MLGLVNSALEIVSVDIMELPPCPSRLRCTGSKSGRRLIDAVLRYMYKGHGPGAQLPPTDYAQVVEVRTPGPVSLPQKLPRYGPRYVPRDLIGPSPDIPRA